ncbi:hypothetical protein LTS18_008830 [Coniosporium uncinatum]|uniref:Uncharacterized protein n=1 Tax=Coniosporium uncinatum TaxID=93489 RepID=A0ACC3DAA0_9PEZI|nr:hypothetical protein LTS18_008830 [Coniosporium uncinatum]
MVRIKNRYLLLHILYPTTTTTTTTTTTITTSVSSPANDLLLLSHTPSPASLTPQLLLRHIRSHLSLLFGDYGAGVVGGSLALKYFSAATSTAMLRVARQHYRMVWAAVSWIARLPKGVLAGEGECVVRVVRVSGSIRSCGEECVRRAKEEILRVRRGSGVGGRKRGDVGVVAVGAVGGVGGREVEGGEEDAGVKVARGSGDEVMEMDGGEVDVGIEDEDEDEEDGEEGNDEEG